MPSPMSRITFFGLSESISFLISRELSSSESWWAAAMAPVAATVTRIAKSNPRYLRLARISFSLLVISNELGWIEANLGRPGCSHAKRAFPGREMAVNLQAREMRDCDGQW